jgi:alkylhydroperoxidase family enzyme
MPVFEAKAALSNWNDRPHKTLNSWTGRRVGFVDGTAMANRNDNQTSHDVVKRLVRETGVSEAQARELVRLIGLDWSSLVREAKLITSAPRD